MNNQDPFWTLLRPKSVAVVGASGKPGGMAGAPILNLTGHGFTGTIYPVNPTRTEIRGLPTFPTLADLPEVPDTAVIVLPADKAVDAFEECCRLGVKSATIVASGFQEGAAGASGGDRVNRLRIALEGGATRLLGPNTTGVMNIQDGYVPRAAINHPWNLRPGGVAVATQSGGLCNILACKLSLDGAGVAYAIACGNQLDVDLWESVEFFLADENVSTIVVAPEAAGDRQRIMECGRLARSLGKTIVALELGRSAVGRSMATTHSGAISSASRVARAVLLDAGIHCTSSIDETVDVARLLDALSGYGRNLPGGFRRAAIIATSGGEAIVAADAADAYGVELSDLDAQTVDDLSKNFAYAEVKNPFDVTGQAVGESSLLGASVRAFDADPTVDVIVICTAVGGSPFAKELFRDLAAISIETPALLAVRTLGTEDAESAELLAATRLPVFEGSEDALRAMAGVRALARGDEVDGDSARPRSTGGPAPDPQIEGVPTLEPYWSARSIVAGSGIGSFSPAVLVKPGEEGTVDLDALRPPLVIKASSRSVGHKYESGFVRLGVPTAAAAREHAADFNERLWRVAPPGDGEGVVIEQQATSRFELILGGITDPVFGKMLTLGLGGSFVEQLDAAEVATVPLTPRGLARLVGTDPVGRLLSTRPGLSERLAAVVSRAAEWFGGDGAVISFDLNPIAILDEGEPLILDARIERI